MKKKHFTLYKNSHYFSSFPSAALLENSELLIIFRRARDSRWLLDDNSQESKHLKHQVDHIDSRSQLTKIHFDLNLKALTEPEPLNINPETADQDASLLILSNNNILLSSFSWYPIHSRLANELKNHNVRLYGKSDITGCFYIFWGGFTRLSSDLGKTWSPHNFLPKLPNSNDIIPGKRFAHGGAIRGQAIEIENEILLPVYNTLKNDKVTSSHLYVSYDKGQTWSYRSLIARDKEQMLDLNEPSIIQLEGDKIMAFLRNTSGNDHLITTVSYDRGFTWSEWNEQNVIGHPTHPLKLSDGRIFISYGYRHKPFGIRARFLDGLGKKFISDEIIIRDDGLCGDVGYPWSVELPDRRILIVYYFTEADGIRHISATELTLD